MSTDASLTAEPRPEADAPPGIEAAGTMSSEHVLELLGSSTAGLSEEEVARRSGIFGPNAVRSHHAGALSVLTRQVNSPLLWLLAAAAAVSAFVGEGFDAAIIGVILVASIGLGFVNEYRAERAAEAMHSEIRHLVTAVRDGTPTQRRDHASRSPATSCISTSVRSSPPTCVC